MPHIAIHVAPSWLDPAEQEVTSQAGRAECSEKPAKPVDKHTQASAKLVISPMRVVLSDDNP
jgi:hypothetical protein